MQKGLKKQIPSFKALHLAQKKIRRPQDVRRKASEKIHPFGAKKNTKGTLGQEKKEEGSVSLTILATRAAKPCAMI
jgi:hypothetical protein